VAVAHAIDYMMRNGAEHGFVCANLAYQLKRYLADHPVGLCFVGTGFDLARSITMDVAVLLDSHDIPIEPIRAAPDLAVRVIAPTDNFEEIETEAEMLQAAGTRHIWIIRPRVRMATVHRAGHELRVLGESETLEAEDILPGLSIRIADLFS
jgi:Uma2 family endonuclease